MMMNNEITVFLPQCLLNTSADTRCFETEHDGNSTNHYEIEVVLSDFFEQKKRDEYYPFLEPVQWFEDLKKKQYTHLLTCSGDRRFLPGVKGHCCSCPRVGEK
jgi:hypothetical protein